MFTFILTSDNLCLKRLINFYPLKSIILIHQCLLLYLGLFISIVVCVFNVGHLFYVTSPFLSDFV